MSSSTSIEAHSVLMFGWSTRGTQGLLEMSCNTFLIGAKQKLRVRIH